MSEASYPRVIANPSPTVTVVKPGPFVVRHLAPGKPFLSREDGRYVLVRPQNASDIPRVRLTESLRYRINTWLISHDTTWYVSPLTFPSLLATGFRKKTLAFIGRWSHHACLKASTSMRVRIRLQRFARTLGRSALIALFGFLALMGITRFVHVDVRTVFHSIHFDVPHFLTLWRKQDDPVDATSDGQPQGYPTLAYNPGITPHSFVLPGGDAHASSGSSEDKPLARANGNGWIPLPGGGPLPTNMPTYGDDAPVHLTIHGPVFTAPDDQADDGDSADAVKLLAPTPTGQSAESESGSVVAKKQVSETTPPPATVKKDQRTAPRTLAVHDAHETPATREGGRTSQQIPVPQSRDAIDVQLMTATTQAPSAPPEQETAVQESRARKSADNTPTTPDFNVVTKNGDALIVVDHGQMKQVSVGQTLPDGSTLLSVSQHGGGFSTSRGNYVAY